MILYDDLLRCAPPGGTREERDAWFADHDIDVDALLRVSREVATFRLATLNEGEVVTEETLTLALQSATLFGFELAVRVLNNEVAPVADEDAAE